MSPRQPPTLPLLTRLTALASAVLVALLTIFAASPQLHALLHGPAHRDAHASAAPCPHGHHHSTPAPEPAPDDDLCVVTQFSHGSSELAVAPALLPAQPLALLGDTLPLSVFCAPSAPAFLLPPGCGPPLV